MGKEIPSTATARELFQVVSQAALKYLRVASYLFCLTWLNAMLMAAATRFG